MEKFLNHLNTLSHPFGPTRHTRQINEKAFLNCFPKPFTLQKILVHFASDLVRDILLLISPAAMVLSDFNEVKLIGIVAPLLAYYVIGLANLKVIDQTETQLNRQIEDVDKQWN